MYCKTTPLMVALLAAFGVGGAIGLHYLCGWPWIAIAAMFITVPAGVVWAVLSWFKRGTDERGYD